MKSTTETKTVITLELNDEERIWLKRVMQNPFYDLEPYNESSEDAEMRAKFFEAMGDFN